MSPVLSLFNSLLLFFCLFPYMGGPREAVAQETAIYQTNSGLTDAQLMQQTLDGIRRDYDFDHIKQDKFIKALSCFAKGSKGCVPGVPDDNNQFFDIQNAYTLGHCEIAKRLNRENSLFCKLLQRTDRSAFDQLVLEIQASDNKYDSAALAGTIAIARGYINGGDQCQKFIQEIVGKDTESWTPKYYQKIIDCKMIFDNASAAQLEKDLVYFSMARLKNDLSQCALIRDHGIKTFCQGGYATPAADNK